jgi:hypothetical protein
MAFSGADFEHMVPELAALMSQKFTFSVSINTKNLTQRNVSFQVNGVVTFFGKQTHIPKPRDVSYDHSNTSSMMLSLQTPGLLANDGPTFAKKWLDHKVNFERILKVYQCACVFFHLTHFFLLLCFFSPFTCSLQIIPCRRSLTFVVDDNPGEKVAAVDGTDNTIDAPTVGTLALQLETAGV